MSCAGNMSGCGSRLCMACRPVLRQYRMSRTQGGQTSEYTVCGFTAAASGGKRSEQLEIPGRHGAGASGLRLTVVACSCAGGVQKNDRVTADGAEYRVTVVKSGEPAVAVLINV